jgi:integrase
MTHVPTLTQVRDGKSTSIFEYLRTECAKHLDQNTLDTLVMLLPLQELHVFRGSNPTRQLEVEALRVNHPIPQPEHSAYPFKQDCAQEVASSLAGLACVVKNNLREAALFTLLLSGMRAIDIVTTKVARLDDLYTSIPWRTQNSCTPGESVTSLTAKGDLARYIREAKFSVGDYLFPSERDARTPMTEGELCKIVYSWLVAARLERAQAFLLSAPPTCL